MSSSRNWKNTLFGSATSELRQGLGTQVQWNICWNTEKGPIKCPHSQLSLLILPLSAYRELLAGFKARGLDEVEIAVTDGLSGIDEAVSESYPGAKRQRCYVHLLRNICSKVRARDRAEVAEDFMAIAKQRDKASGESAMAAFVAKWKSKYPKLKVWSEKTEDVLTFYDFPEGLRRLVYTNNRIESFNKQIK